MSTERLQGSPLRFLKKVVQKGPQGLGGKLAEKLPQVTQEGLPGRLPAPILPALLRKLLENSRVVLEVGFPKFF